MKSFSHWTIVEVEKEFEVKLQQNYHLLETWLNCNEEPGQKSTEVLQHLQVRLIKHVYDWNEQELKIRFIGPLLELVDFDQGHYQPFFERVIAAPYKNETLAGDVNFLVANGRLWNFVVLNGQEYAVSLAYDATKQEINDIFYILSKTKVIIDTLVSSSIQ